VGKKQNEVGAVEASCRTMVRGEFLLSEQKERGRWPFSDDHGFTRGSDGLKNGFKYSGCLWIHVVLGGRGKTMVHCFQLLADICGNP
jgi:hypothetical protein